MRQFILRSLPRWLSVGCLSGLLIVSAAYGQLDEDPFGDLGPGAGAPGEPEAVDPMAELQEEQPKTLDEVLQEGRDLAAAGNCVEALQVFNAIIGQNPRIWQAQFEKGKCLADLKELDAAIAALSNAAVYGQVPEVFLERGHLYFQTQQYAEAANDYMQAVQLSPGNAEYLFLRGKAFTRQAQQLGFLGGDSTSALFRAAVSSFDRAIDLQPDYTEAYFERGLTKSSLGQTEEAIEDVQAALQKEPTPDGHARLGFIFLRRADVERRKPLADRQQAVRDYMSAITEFDAFVMAKGDPMMVVSKAEKEDPEYIPPQNVLVARCLARIGAAAMSSNVRNSDAYDLAIMDCNSALAFDVSDNEQSSYLLQRGVAERLNGDLETAIESFTNSYEINRGNYEALLRRGIAYYYSDELDLAEQDLQQASVALLNGRVQFWLGAVHSRRGEFREAIRFYSQSLRENLAAQLPGNLASINNRGLAYMRLGEYERAAQDFAELVRRDGNNTIARSRLEMARQQLDTP